MEYQPGEDQQPSQHTGRVQEQVSGQPTVQCKQGKAIVLGIPTGPFFEFDFELLNQHQQVTLLKVTQVEMSELSENSTANVD